MLTAAGDSLKIEDLNEEKEEVEEEEETKKKYLSPEDLPFEVNLGENEKIVEYTTIPRYINGEVNPEHQEIVDACYKEQDEALLENLFTAFPNLPVELAKQKKKYKKDHQQDLLRRAYKRILQHYIREYNEMMEAKEGSSSEEEEDLFVKGSTDCPEVLPPDVETKEVTIEEYYENNEEHFCKKPETCKKSEE